MEEAAELLRDSEHLEFLETAAGNRISFANAAASGLGVLKTRPADEKAITQVNELYNSVQRIVATIKLYTFSNKLAYNY